MATEVSIGSHRKRLPWAALIAGVLAIVTWVTSLVLRQNEVVVGEDPIQLFSWWSRLEGVGSKSPADVMAASGLTIIDRPIFLIGDFHVRIGNDRPIACMVDFRRARGVVAERAAFVGAFTDVVFYYGENRLSVADDVFRNVRSFPDLCEFVALGLIPIPSVATVRTVAGCKYRDVSWFGVQIEPAWMSFRDDELRVRSENTR